MQAFVVSADGTSTHSTRSRFLVLATPASGWPSTLSAVNGTSTALNPSSEEFSPRAPRHRQPPLRRPPRAARQGVFRSKQYAHKNRLTHCSGSLRSRPGHMKWSANKSPQHLAIHAEGSCDTRRRILRYTQKELPFRPRGSRAAAWHDYGVFSRCVRRSLQPTPSPPWPISTACLRAIRKYTCDD